MRNYKNLIIFGGITLLFVAGCSNDIKTNATENEEKEVALEKRVETKDNFGLSKKIKVTNDETIQKAENILADVEWENAQVSMATPFYAEFSLAKNEQMKAAELIYYLWISPSRDQIELVIKGESKYAQLSKSQSAELFKIITGGNLSDV